MQERSSAPLQAASQSRKEVRIVKVGKPTKITIVTPKENPVPSKLPPLPERLPVLVP
jgi:hypothetical protein